VTPPLSYYRRSLTLFLVVILSLALVAKLAVVVLTELILILL